MAFEPYVRRFWPQLLIGWTRLLSGRVRDPLVGRDILVGVAGGTVGAMLIASRELIPHLARLPMPTPQLPPATILLGMRYAIDAALEVLNRAIFNALQIVCIVAFLKMLLRQTWIVVAVGVVLILPIAMSGTFAGEQLALELGIALGGIALVLTVLLRFGLLALVVTFYTFLTMELFPLTIDFSRPYAGRGDGGHSFDRRCRGVWVLRLAGRRAAVWPGDSRRGRRLMAQEPRHQPPSPTPSDFRRHGHALVDWIADYFERLETYPVLARVKPGDITRALPDHAPEDANRSTPSWPTSNGSWYRASHNGTTRGSSPTSRLPAARPALSPSSCRRR
jgi:hypothetical protein